MDDFLQGMSIPSLSEQDRIDMEAPVTLEEIKRAVAGMPSQKSTGPDRLPVEIYKRYGEALLPELLKTLGWALTNGRLHTSVSEATIIVIHKEGKDQLDVFSYRPISLLCTDVKILAKVLATCLNRCIQGLIHPDQSDFIPNRSTSINIRRVFLNMQIPTDNLGSKAILALDAAKAFDSLEWDYLWKVLVPFGFGPSFISWVRLLYSKPRAKIKINNEYSEVFQLERGTRQGCPLSPLLFAFAMEPLAIMTRSRLDIQGFRRQSEEDRIALFADDVLFFLGDVETSLNSVIQMLGEFGRLSGPVIN